MSEVGKKAKLFDDGYFGKIVLLVLDKVLLGIVVIWLLTPMQQKLTALQQRHDKATRIADLVVDKSIETLGRLSVDVDQYTVAIRTRVRGSTRENAPLVESRARIEAEVATVSAYLPTPEVRQAGKDLEDVVRKLTVEAMAERLLLLNVDQLEQRVRDVNDKETALLRQVVAACREEISENVDQAYK